jgi:hypothetical protein
MDQTKNSENETKCTRNAPGVNHCGICGEEIGSNDLVTWDSVSQVVYHTFCLEQEFDLTNMK